jgi:hypothetical protein
MKRLLQSERAERPLPGPSALRIGLLLAALAWCAPASAQTFVQSCQNSATSAAAVTVTCTTSVNNLVIVYCRQNINNTATAAITDSSAQGGWAQTSLGYKDDATGNRASQWTHANSAALTSVTCTWSPNPTATVTATVFEVSGMAASSPEDAAIGNNQGSGTTATSGSLTTTNANDILVFSVGLGGAFSAPAAGAGYTLPANDTTMRNFVTYKIVSATQSGVTTTGTWTTAELNVNFFIAYKAAAAAGAPQRSLMGVGR